MNQLVFNSPAICYGEILWDMLPDGPQPGGAPLNVAYHLSNFGMETSIISRIGNDENGKKLEDLLDQWHIKKQFLQVDSIYPTSKVIANISDRNEVSYEILYPVAWDFIDNVDELLSQITASTYLIYGSLAARSITSRDTLLKLLDTESIKVFDINLRPPFVDKELLKILLYKADIVKFNQSELKMVQELFEGSNDSEIAQVKFVQQYFNIPEVIITKGDKGASYYRNEQIFSAGGTEIEVNDTIGSGDAFLAAFVNGHYLNEKPHMIIKNAVAMGAFIATKKGGCPVYELNDYRNFKNQKF